MDKSAEEPLFGKTSGGTEDSFYDTIETSSPDYDNAMNSSQQGEIQDPEERARQQAEWQSDLAKLEEEINTLRTVLSAKVNQAAVLKRNLGITPMTEFKSDLKQGFNNIKGSDAYQKTNSAFKSFGAFASKKFGDMRNSNTFKSFEEKMGGAYSNVKTKMRGSQSENNFGAALDSPTEPMSVENPASETALTPDAEKQPL